MIRIELPYHLRTLANLGPEISLDTIAPATMNALLDALEQRHPMLRGTIRDRQTHKRRPMLRFFACGEDISLEPLDQLLPKPVIDGEEPLLVVGAISGG